MQTEDDIDSIEALSWLEQPDGKDRTVGEDRVPETTRSMKILGL